MILRKVAAFYEWGHKGSKINHLLFMDDLKVFSKNENQMDSLVQTVHFFSKDIRIEFGINRCRVLVLEGGKVVKIKALVLPNGRMMRKIDEPG